MDIKDLQEMDNLGKLTTENMESVTTALSIGNVFKSLQIQQSAMQAIASSINMPSARMSKLAREAYQSSTAMQALVAQQSTMESIAKSLVIPSDTISQLAREAYANYPAMNFAVAQESSIKKALRILDSPLVLQSLTAHHSIFSEAIKTEAIFKRLSSMSSFVLNKPSYISEMANIVSNIDWDAIDTLSDVSDFEEEIDEAVTQFAEVVNKENFIEVFSKVAPWIQVHFLKLIIVLCLFVGDIAGNAAANLLTPHIEEYLAINNEKLDQQKVEEISLIPQSLEDFDTDALRFITGNDVFLRAEPSTNSKVSDELIFGQVVTVLTKKKNWIKIMYIYEDGEPVSGWIFIRYTAKFVK